MALSRTKTAITWLASVSCSAAATQTGTAQDLTGADTSVIDGTYTNGSTGPTIGITQYVEVSNDNTNFDIFTFETAPTTNSATGNFQPVEIPPSVMYARVRYTGNTGQAVTVAARGSKVVYS